MKAKCLVLAAAALLAFGISSNVNATDASGFTYAQYTPQGRTVVAIYVGNGGINRILIKVQGDYVVAYCSGYDYNGRQVWEEIQPAKIQRNYGGARTSNSEAQRATQMKNYTAKIGQVTIYF